jgi:hypothetical protein
VVSGNWKIVFSLCRAYNLFAISNSKNGIAGGGSKGKEKATPALNAGKLRACVEIRR